jgi:hypothetical protein
VLVVSALTRGSVIPKVHAVPALIHVLDITHVLAYRAIPHTGAVTSKGACRASLILYSTCPGHSTGAFLEALIPYVHVTTVIPKVLVVSAIVHILIIPQVLGVQAFLMELVAPHRCFSRNP